MNPDRSPTQEALVSLYLRLNGYFSSGFICHAPIGVSTELDLLAVRFPGQCEPEVEEGPCPRLDLSEDVVDFIIAEVKSNDHGDANFNTAFRNKPEAIRSTLRRFGALSEDEITRIVGLIPDLLNPDKVRYREKFPQIDVNASMGLRRLQSFAFYYSLCIRSVMIGKRAPIFSRMMS